MAKIRHDATALLAAVRFRHDATTAPSVVAEVHDDVTALPVVSGVCNHELSPKRLFFEGQEYGSAKVEMGEGKTNLSISNSRNLLRYLLPLRYDLSAVSGYL